MIDPIRAALETAAEALERVAYRCANVHTLAANQAANAAAIARTALAAELPAPAPVAGHIPAATKMVGDGDREELAEWLDREAKSCAVQFRGQITRAAALLRQPAPEGLVVQEYVHLDSGARIISEPIGEQSGGCWVVRNSRKVSVFADFPTVAAALAALEPPQGGEVAP